MYVAVAAFLVGVASETVLPDVWSVGSYVALVGGLGLGLGFLYGGRKSALLVLLGCLGFVGGMVRMEIAASAEAFSVFDHGVESEVELHGLVVADPDVREATQYLIVRVGEARVRVTANRYQAIAYGDSVTVTGRLKSPEPFLTDTGRLFNYPMYLRAKGVAYVIPYGQVTVTDRGGGLWVVARLYELKGWAVFALEQSLPAPESALAAGILLGVAETLGPLADDFRTVGLTHIVVLSGYNLMLVVAAITVVASAVPSWRVRLLFALCFVIAFAVMVGLTPSVTRATIMAVLMIGAILLGRRYDPLRALLLVVVAMVLWNPYVLGYDLGFQLSVLATLGIIAVAPRLELQLATAPVSVSLRELLTATVATQLAVLPVLLYAVGEVSLVAVVANVLVLPVVPIAMLGSVVALLGFFIWPGAAPFFAFPAHLALSYIITVTETMARVPYASVLVPSVSMMAIAIPTASMLAVGIGYSLWRRPRSAGSPLRSS